MCCGKGGRRGIYKAAATLGVRARVWKTGAGSAGDRGRSSLRERGIREEEDRADRWGPGAARRGERDAGRWDRGSAGATRARTGELACGTRPSAPRRGESECGRVGPAFACEQAVWRGPSRGGKELGPGARVWLGRGAGRSGGSGPRERGVSWASVGFSWAGQVGPSAGKGRSAAGWP